MQWQPSPPDTSQRRTKPELQRIEKVKRVLNFTSNEIQDQNGYLFLDNDIIICPVESSRGLVPTCTSLAVSSVINDSDQSMMLPIQETIITPGIEDNLHADESLHYNRASQFQINNKNITPEQKEKNCGQDKILTRKRQQNPESWKRVTKRNKREKGQEYIDEKGHLHPAKHVKPGCQNNCHFQCSNNFSIYDQNRINKEFYQLSDIKKQQYFGKFTKRQIPTRKRTKNIDSRKKYTFQYFFPKDGQPYRVCKVFFCSVLDISQRRIYYFHEKFNKSKSCIPPTPAKGKHIKKVTAVEKIEEVVIHIKSFPVEESHFCRKNSKRQYLDRSLSISKMFNLYKQAHSDPVKENIYRKVFNTRFNLSFYKPKKDNCDTCFEYRATKNPDDTKQIQYEEHIKRKEEGNEERESDRKIYNKKNKISPTNHESVDANTAVVTFDLENVFSLPKANISCFFYKSKLCVYNLTAHCNANSTVYNCIWNETFSGRSGNDIASALVTILKQIVLDLPHIKRIILWSDSCVPQNRNSHMSMAIITFLKSPAAGCLEEIIQKFCEPGHGNVQEVDAAHSIIERHLRHLEIYSPLSLLRNLKKIQSGSLKFQFIQMFRSDFLAYNEAAMELTFSNVPYTKVKYIVYNKLTWNMLGYKRRFTEKTTLVNIIRDAGSIIHIRGDIQIKAPPDSIAIKKIDDIVSMYKFMPDDDKTYYEALFKRFKNDSDAILAPECDLPAKSNKKSRQTNGAKGPQNKSKKKTQSNIKKEVKQRDNKKKK